VSVSVFVFRRLRFPFKKIRVFDRLRYVDRLQGVDSVIAGLKNIYHKKIEPVEKTYEFQAFHSPLMVRNATVFSLVLPKFFHGLRLFLRVVVVVDAPSRSKMAISTRNQWFCFWANTRLAKRHSSNIFSREAFRDLTSVTWSLSNRSSFHNTHTHTHTHTLSIDDKLGPEPTTDKFCAIQYGTEERVIPGNALAVQADQPYRGLQQFGTSFLNRFQALSRARCRRRRRRRHPARARAQGCDGELRRCWRTSRSSTRPAC
jgi:hypothetical protein